MIKNIFHFNSTLKSLVTIFVINHCLESYSFAENTLLSKNVMTESSNLQQTSLTKIPETTNRYSFADIVEPLIPAVVNVYTVQYSKKLPNSQKKSLDHFPLDHFNELLEHFNLPFNFEEMYSNPKSVSLGSGFIIDSDGFIVTNHHVIANADEIYVKLTDNKEILAKLIGSDKKTDLALLKIDVATPLSFVKFGDSGKARVGDWIIAIGNPFGRLGGTVTAGIISSKGRDIDSSSGVVDDFIQTDAAINNGNSGGPMFNVDGDVIGVNTAIFSPYGTNIGIGFAIPSNTAKLIIDQLKKNGKISRGRLGVVIQEVTSEIAEGFGLKEALGALVVEVKKDSPGDKFGIKPGDIIIEFAGQIVKNSRKLQVMLAEAPIEQQVEIVVMRDGNQQKLNGKINDEDLEQTVKNEVKDKITDKFSTVKNNIIFSNLTDEVRTKFSIKNNINGIIVTKIAIDEKTPFKIGDLVVSINQQPISSIEQLNLLYNDAKVANKQNIILLVKRKSSSVFVPLPIKD